MLGTRGVCVLDSDPLPFFSHCVFLLLFCFYFLFFFFGRLRRVSPSVSGDESGRNASFIRRGGSFVCSDAAAIHRSTASFPRTHFFLPYFPVSLIKSFFVSVCLCVCVCVCACVCGIAGKIQDESVNSVSAV